jgi:hypothetical protein
MPVTGFATKVITESKSSDNKPTVSWMRRANKQFAGS